MKIIQNYYVLQATIVVIIGTEQNYQELSNWGN